MRVSDHTIYSSILNNLSHLMGRQEHLHDQLSSGKRITKPSDDPSGFTKSLGMKTELGSGRQYVRNIDDTIAWTQTTSGALSDVSSALQRAGELAIEGGDGTKVQSELDAIAEEVEQILRHVIDASNTKQLGRSIFSGNETLQPAFSITGYDANGNVAGVAYNGDSGIRNIEIGTGRLLPVNSLGSNEAGGAPRAVFRNTLTGLDVFQTLMDLRDDLLTGNVNAVLNTDIGNVQACVTNVMSFQSEVGSKQNRLELNSTELGDREAGLVELISQNEDLDYAEAILHLSEVQTTYKAALASGARIMDTTLLDFLR